MSDEKNQTSAGSPQTKPDNVGEVEVVEVEVLGRRRRDRVEIRVPPGIAVRTAGDHEGTRIVLLGFGGGAHVD